MAGEVEARAVVLPRTGNRRLARLSVRTVIAPVGERHPLGRRLGIRLDEIRAGGDAHGHGRGGLGLRRRERAPDRRAVVRHAVALRAEGAHVQRHGRREFRARPVAQALGLEVGEEVVHLLRALPGHQLAVPRLRLARVVGADVCLQAAGELHALDERVASAPGARGGQVRRRRERGRAFRERRVDVLGDAVHVGGLQRRAREVPQPAGGLLRRGGRAQHDRNRPQQGHPSFDLHIAFSSQTM